MKLKLTLFFSLLTMCLFAQKITQDVIYLKNGNVIRGVIVEQIPNKSFKIETLDGSILSYDIGDVEKITKEENKSKKSEKVTDENSGVRYQGRIENGYAFKMTDDDFSHLKFSFINGFKFNKHISLGLGTGVRYYDELDEVLIPIFTDFRVNFLKHKVSPYVGVGLGYSFNVSDNFEGAGLMGNLGLGVIFNFNKRNSLNFGLGFEAQSLTIIKSNTSYNYNDGYYGSYNNHTTEETNIYKAISLNLGFSF